MTEWAFWGAVAALVYTFAGYPALVILLARVRPRPVRRAPHAPDMSVLIAAHDEAAVIAARIENCLALDYPADRLEIIVASDGSTDGTVGIARRYAQQNGPGRPTVRVHAYPWRRGKPAVLDDSIPRCRGALVLLGDARQRWEPDTARLLAENFADPAVGAASGELMLVNAAGRAVGEGVGAYWRYEKAIRRAESAVHSTVGATGAIYMIRRSLFQRIPVDTLDDDVLIPLRIARAGFRVVFDERARAWDRVAASGREEFTRKVRTIAGIVQLFARERWLWRPGHPVWIQAVSHKLLRLAAPFLMMTALAANAALVAAGGVYTALFVAQVGFYAAAAAGAVLSGRAGRLARVLALPYAFCLLNLTTVVSVARYASGRQTVQWRKAAEAARSEAA